MKTYEVELERTSYITVTVEAENEDHAEALAWQTFFDAYGRPYFFNASTATTQWEPPAGACFACNIPGSSQGRVKPC